MKPLSCVMVGAGYFARFQAAAWKRLAGIDVAAVVDPVRERAEVFCQEFGIPRSYDSAEAALDAVRPDFVDIVTRPEAHVELTELAASKGAHVICQKPMAPTMAECVRMCECCERQGVRLLIHENWRWQPWYREVKSLMESGVIGRVFQVAFFWRTGDGCGPSPYPAQPYFVEMPRLLVYETLVHILDTFRFLAGEVESLSCQMARVNPVIRGEDQALIQMKFTNGVQGLIDANRISGPVPSPVAMGTLVVEGDIGRLRVSPEGFIWLALAGGEERRLPFEPPQQGYKGDSVLATQRHLTDSIGSGVRSESDGREYLKTVVLVEACYDSAERGERIRPAVKGNHS